LKDLVHRLKLGDNVEFCGVLDSMGVNDLLERSHIMVMPSLKEAFGVAALEASAGGRPVVAARVGGIPEVVHDGETGVLVPPGDARALAEAIIRLGRDRAMLYRMGEAGWRFARDNYTWKNSLDAMTALYEKLLNG
jgi:glycosyltransferase involved in cell wall biosynthesis